MERDIRGRRTEQAIMESTFDLLAKREFSSMTVRDICAAAGISRTTFYVHFQDKYSLILRCVEEIIQGVPARKGGDRIECYITSLLDEVYDKQKILLKLHKIQDNKELERKMNEMFVRIYRDYYTERRETGTVFPVPLEIAAIYHSGGVMQLINWWLESDCATDRETMLGYIMQLHENSLADTPPH